MSITESIRTYLCTCPFLKDGIINVDYLGEKPTEYTVECVPAAKEAKRYTDGSSLKQYLFLFASREYYGQDVLTNIENSRFYEQFSNWISQQDKKGIYPVLENGIPQKIETLSSGYLFHGNGTDARYQIQCRLTYYEK